MSSSQLVIPMRPDLGWQEALPLPPEVVQIVEVEVFALKAVLVAYLAEIYHCGQERVAKVIRVKSGSHQAHLQAQKVGQEG